MRDALETMIEEVLRPLLQADGGDIELVSVEDAKVVVRTKGEAAFGAGSHYVRVSVIEPAIRKVVGADVDIAIEKAVPKATRRSDPGRASEP
ncbi:MAG: NifU family protein [Deltaproteobacteria bacterium]|nr:NifU family protein [Deltaproteobacteria bacterium]